MPIFLLSKKLNFESNATRIVGAYFSDTANHAHWPSLSEIPSIGKELAKKKGQTEKKLVKAKSAAGQSEKGQLEKISKSVSWHTKNRQESKLKISVANRFSSLN